MNPLKLGVGGDLPKIKNLNQKMCSKGPKIPFFGSHLSAFSHLSDPTEIPRASEREPKNLNSYEEDATG